MIDAAFAEVQPLLSTSAACTLLGKARATHFWRLSPAPVKPAVPRCAPANQRDEAERWAVLDVLRSPRFVDAPGAGVGHSAGRGPLPVLAVEHVPAATPQR